MPQKLLSYVKRYYYSMGFLSITAFVLICISGLILVLYGPNWWLTTSAGLYFRSVHMWANQALIFFIILHTIVVLLRSSYKKPKQLDAWVLGTILLFLALIGAEFGYLLRGDFSSQWRALQASDLYNGSGLGAFINNLNWGQVYGIHVVFIPLIMLLAIVLHYPLMKLFKVPPPKPGDAPEVAEAKYKAVKVSHKKLYIRGGVLVVVIIVLSIFFKSPTIIPTTIQSVAKSDPALIGKTIVSELDHTSDTATYLDNINPYTYDTKDVYVVGPYRDYLKLQNGKDILAVFENEPHGQQQSDIQNAQDYFENGGEVDLNSKNPLVVVASLLIKMAESGLYESSVQASANNVNDLTYVTRFLADTGLMEAKAESLGITTEQYGMLREETGAFPPGAWWLAPIGILNHTVLSNDPNQDRDGAEILAFSMFLLTAFPFIPFYWRKRKDNLKYNFMNNKKYKNFSAILASVVVLGGAVYLFQTQQPKKIDVLTYHYDDARTGANTKETTLTPENVTLKTFGKLFSIPVDGQVYAQPLYKSNVVLGVGQESKDLLFIATANDNLYAADAHTGQIVWKDSFVDAKLGTIPVPNVDTQSTDINPNIGIIGTPVIDDSTNTLYVVSKDKKVLASSTTYEQYIHAIDLASGKEKFSGPKLIEATSTSSQNVVATFNALIENQRASLLLFKNKVYVTWASHGDNGPYHGWILGYDASDLSKNPIVFNDTKNGVQGGIWMSGGGISTDGDFIYVAVGNGDFDPSQGNYGESVLKLREDGDTLAVVDYFAPFNKDLLNTEDKDMGVSDVLVIPDSESGSMSLVAAADKLGEIHILNRSDLGKFDPKKDHSVQKLLLTQPLINNIAYFNHMLYVGGNNIPLQAFTLNNGLFSATSTSQTAKSFGNGGIDGSGSNPTISSNGLNNAIVWMVDNSPYYVNQPAILHAYDASDLSLELYRSDFKASDTAAPAVKFTSAVVTNGTVYIAGNGAVTVYGLLNK